MNRLDWRTFSVLLGACGGALLVAVNHVAHKGFWIFLPYSFLLAGVAVYNARSRTASSRRRFMTYLTALLVATAVLYAYVSQIKSGDAAEITTSGHLSRIAVVAACVIAVSAIAALAHRPTAGLRNT